MSWLCRLLGHRWTDWWTHIDWDAGRAEYRCRRCHAMGYADARYLPTMGYGLVDGGRIRPAPIDAR